MGASGMHPTDWLPTQPAHPIGASGTHPTNRTPVWGRVPQCTIQRASLTLNRPGKVTEAVVTGKARLVQGDQVAAHGLAVGLGRGAFQASGLFLEHVHLGQKTPPIDFGHFNRLDRAGDLIRSAIAMF